MINFRSDLTQMTEYSFVIKTTGDLTHRTHCASITKTRSRLLYTKTTVAFCNITQHTLSTVYRNNAEFYC
jgi:hypothetical protein